MATHAPVSGNFDIGRVLSRGFQTIANQFVVFAALGILFAGLPGAVFGLLMPDSQSPAAIEAAIVNPLFWLTILSFIPLSYLLQAALVRASILDLRSEPVEFGPLLGESLMLLIPMIALSIVTVVAVSFGFLLLIVPGIILFTMWIVSVPVLVEERLGIFGSMARSAELTKGARWWIFLLFIIYLFASSIVSSASGIVFTATGSTTGWVPIIVGIVINTITGIIAAAMLASLYIELRMIKEGVVEDSLAQIFA